MYKFDFTLHGKKYQAQVPDTKEHYVLCSVNDYGIAKKIPCFTDAEEKRFPKCAGYVATAFLHGLKQVTD